MQIAQTRNFGTWCRMMWMNVYINVLFCYTQYCEVKCSPHVYIALSIFITDVVFFIVGIWTLNKSDIYYEKDWFIVCALWKIHKKITYKQFNHNCYIEEITIRLFSQIVQSYYVVNMLFVFYEAKPKQTRLSELSTLFTERFYRQFKSLLKTWMPLLYTTLSISDWIRQIAHIDTHLSMCYPAVTSSAYPSQACPMEGFNVQWHETQRDCICSLACYCHRKHQILHVFRALLCFLCLLCGSSQKIEN